MGNKVLGSASIIYLYNFFLILQMLKLRKLVVHLDCLHLVLVAQILIQVRPVIQHHLVIQVILNMVSYFIIIE